MGYLGESLRGFSWMGAFRLATRGFAYLRIAILARLLTPSQFGLFGIAFLALSFLESVTATGINVILIQERKDIDEFVDTAWVISIARGLFIAILLVVLSPLIASFFNAVGSETLLMLVGLVAFIRGFINPSRVKFKKELEFNKEFWFSFVVFLTDSITVITLTFLLRSPVSLVLGLVAGAVMEVTLSFLLIKPVPKLSLDRYKLKLIINRGRWVTATRIFNYLLREGDDIVVGRLLVTKFLGFYQVAYKISTLPITEIARVVHKVTFPVYSKIADEKDRLTRAYFKTFVGVSVLVIPIGVILLLYPYEIVLIVLGSNWLEIVPVIKILSVYGVIESLTGTSTAFFNASKRQDYVTKIYFIRLLVMAITIIPLTNKYGIIVAGFSVLISAVIAIPLTVYFVQRVIKGANE